MTKNRSLLTAVLITLLCVPVFAATPPAPQEASGSQADGVVSSILLMPLFDLWHALTTALGPDQLGPIVPAAPSSTPDQLDSDPPAGGDHGGALDPNG